MPQGPYGMALANVSLTGPEVLLQLVTAAQHPLQLLEVRVGQESSQTSAMQALQISTWSTGSSTGTTGTITLDNPGAAATTLTTGTGATTCGTAYGTTGTRSSILVGPVPFNVLQGYLWQPVLEDRIWAQGGGGTSGTLGVEFPRAPSPSSAMNWDAAVKWLEYP